MAEHRLKLQRKYWAAKRDGRKPWEIRVCTDRVFAAGDTVIFEEVTDDWGRALTGRTCGPVTIIYLLGHEDSPNIPDGTCIFTHTEVPPHA